MLKYRLLSGFRDHRDKNEAKSITVLCMPKDSRVYVMMSIGTWGTVSLVLPCRSVEDVLPVEETVAGGFGYMLREDVGEVCEVCYGPGQLYDA